MSSNFKMFLELRENDFVHKTTHTVTDTHRQTFLTQLTCKKEANFNIFHLFSLLHFYLSTDPQIFIRKHFSMHTIFNAFYDNIFLRQEAQLFPIWLGKQRYAKLAVGFASAIMQMLMHLYKHCSYQYERRCYL